MARPVELLVSLRHVVFAMDMHPMEVRCCPAVQLCLQMQVLMVVFSCMSTPAKRTAGSQSCVMACTGIMGSGCTWCDAACKASRSRAMHALVHGQSNAGL